MVLGSRTMRWRWMLSTSLYHILFIVSRFQFSVMLVVVRGLVVDPDYINKTLEYGQAHEQTLNVSGFVGEVHAKFKLNAAARRLQDLPREHGIPRHGKFRGGLAKQNSDTSRILVKPLPGQETELERHFHRRLRQGDARISRVLIPATGWYIYQVPQEDVRQWHKQLKRFSSKIEDDVRVKKFTLASNSTNRQSLSSHATASSAWIDATRFLWHWGSMNLTETVQALGGLNDASREVVVAVIDTGVDLDAPINLWQNPGEICGNSIDDDDNGFVDDCHGWNFADNSPDVQDTDGHGTHCAGSIAGQVDVGQGMCGIGGPGVSVMAMKFLGAEGSMSDALQSLQYAFDNGAHISSHSYGGPAGTYAMEALVDMVTANGHLMFSAAGNEAADNDAVPSYPCNYASDGNVCVAALNPDGSIATYSNYGRKTVHMAAPGTNIRSYYPGSRTFVLSGTSMATPIVAGVVALMHKHYPFLTAEQHLRALKRASIFSDGLQLKTKWSGYLDALKYLQEIELGSSISVQPSTFTAPSVTKLTIRADLPEGIYSSSIEFVPVEVPSTPVEAASVRVSITVVGTPELVLSAKSILLANMSVGYRHSAQVGVSNVGNGSLAMDIAAIGSSVITVSPAELVLHPLASGSLTVSCASVDLAEHNAVLRIATNEPQVLNISVHCQASPAPEVTFSHESKLNVFLSEPDASPELVKLFGGRLNYAPAEWETSIDAVDLRNMPLSFEVANEMGCSDFRSELQGTVALVKRGSCMFSQKATNAEKAGAAAIIIWDHSVSGTMMMASGNQLPSIPAFLISLADGEALRANLNGVSVDVLVLPIVAKTNPANMHTSVEQLHLDNFGEGYLRYSCSMELYQYSFLPM